MVTVEFTFVQQPFLDKDSYENAARSIAKAQASSQAA
jgi:hypothetical protein